MLFLLFYFREKVIKEKVLREVVEVLNHETRLFDFNLVKVILYFEAEVRDFNVRGLFLLFAREIVLVEIDAKLPLDALLLGRIR